jgi:hypothetical protein
MCAIPHFKAYERTSLRARFGANNHQRRNSGAVLGFYCQIRTDSGVQVSVKSDEHFAMVSELERAQSYRRQAKYLRDTARLSPLSAASKDLVAAAVHLELMADEIEKTLEQAD